jgi:lipopolysaccharide export system permease protein
MVGKGIEWYIIMELLFYASASFVPLALPLSILLSSIMTFGKLSETYELVALKSAGVSLVGIMTPLIIIVLMMSLGAFFFANNTIPFANLKFHSLLYDIRQHRPALDIKEGVFYNGIDNYSIRITKKSQTSNRIYGIRMYDHTQNKGSENVLIADSGVMYTTPDQRYLIVQLYHGARYEEMESSNPTRPTYPTNRQTFKSYNLRFDLSNFKLARTKEELFKDHYEMLNIGQLNEHHDSINRSIDTNFYYLKNAIRPFIKYYQDTVGMKKLILTPNIALNVKELFPTLSDGLKKNVINSSLLNSRSLRQILEEQSNGIENLKDYLVLYDVEWHRKFALSFACLTLFFIGAPLGAIIRKGGLGLPTVVAIFMFLIFYIITIIGEKSAKQGVWTAFFGMWTPTMILLPIGIFLVYRANQDSISFNFDWLKKLTELAKKYFQKNKNESSIIS